MRLLAISDLHVRHSGNRHALDGLGAHPDDWLILAGDVCEGAADLAEVLDIANAKFARVFWVPGNHELWTTRAGEARGESKYMELVELCRRRGVVTPEDPFVLWPGPGGRHYIALLFLLYDYSFRPDSVALDDAVEWASESGVVCADEMYLHTDPYPSIVDWCAARCEAAAERLRLAAEDAPLILVNHFPMRRELANVPLYPRFSLWCGTTRTHDWHRRYRATAVVTGHLHMPSRYWIDDVRFEEVSFGYPRQRRYRPGGIDAHLREILPGPQSRPDSSPANLIDRLMNF